jgi:hypothetical protein
MSTRVLAVRCSVVTTLLVASACGDDGGGTGTGLTVAPTSVPSTDSAPPDATTDPAPTTAGPTTADPGTSTGVDDTGTTAPDPTTGVDPDTTAGPTTDTTTGVDPNDPFGPPPPMNLWPAGGSDHVTPSGVPFHVDVPAGDTDAALLVIGGWSVKHLSNADGAITISVQSDGNMGPMACPMGGFGVPHNLNALVVQEILVAAGANVRFDHARAFVEADSNNAGWGVEAALDPMNQPFLAGAYVPWAEYNNAPCKAVAAAADVGSPKLLFISQSQCDDTYCPLKHCIDQVKGLGYDVTFTDPLSPATCDCDGPCPGAIDRPHFKGPGDASPIKPWVLATVKP